MLKEKQRLENHIKRLEEEIEKLPKGKLIHIQNRRYHQWYQSDGHLKKYRSVMNVR